MMRCKSNGKIIVISPSDIRVWFAVIAGLIVTMLTMWITIRILGWD